MMDGREIARKVEAVQGLLTAKFGIKQQSLDRMLKRAGRRLPKRVHAKAQVLVKAEHLAQHPKLVRQVDGAAVAGAFDDLKAHLQGIDVADRTRGRVLSITAAVVFNLLVVAAAFVLWLWWRGYV